MNKIEAFEQFMATSSSNISSAQVLMNLALCLVLSLIISYVYVQWGQSLSNRKVFAKNFFIISATTLIVITIVKSSLALSLGLVGALSIIRFRTAIKEPEELTYTFLSIAVGLGLGADQRQITLVSVIFILVVLIAKAKFSISKEGSSLYVSVDGNNNENFEINKIIDAFKSHGLEVSLKRLDESNESFQICFQVALNDYQALEKLRNNLKQIDNSFQLSFINNSTIG
ncbi:MAG: DUF4956 domain-containing protein [Bacteriovoracaceae bacterium]